MSRANFVDLALRLITVIALDLIRMERLLLKVQKFKLVEMMYTEYCAENTLMKLQNY